MGIVAVKFRDPRSSPESLVNSSLHIIRNKGCSAQRARLLLVPHPTVEAALMEDVAAVGEPADLVLGLELVQADGAGLRRVHQVREPHHRKDFPDQNSRHGVEFRDSVRRVGPRNVGLQKIPETQIAKYGGDELSEETQNGKRVEKELREEKLRVAHRKTHGTDRARERKS
ncbi:hypothetical protein F2P56_004798 [Juglans regia]|uniref:Uncharacterized protein n=1 Tax=Juglans regia TaxID=51240 RepID=A0A833XUK2_JUGRE|nr:hypothetical protein F2P56_004798 [Juglans regia]